MTLLNLLELGTVRTHYSFTASSLPGLSCRAVLFLLAFLLVSAPCFPSSGCLERVAMPCPSFGLCSWDLLVPGDQNVPYKPLQVWGTPVSSGGALLPPHCPKSTVRASGCSGFVRRGVRSSPSWGSQRPRCVWCNPQPKYSRSWDTTVASCHTCPFLWPLVTCFKALKAGAGNRGWVPWHCRLLHCTMLHPSLPGAVGRHRAGGPCHWATNLGTWRFPQRVQHPANPQHLCSLARSQGG